MMSECHLSIGRNMVTPTRHQRLRQIVTAMIIALLVSACKVELYTGLKEKEANEMLSQLLDHNLSATKETAKDKTNIIYVEDAHFSKAVELLKQLGLPRRRFVNMGEVFAAEGMVSSPMQEWARLNYALTQELANTISNIPGIVSAEVHLANPRKAAPFEKLPDPSASVLVLVARDAITAELIPQIKQLIAFGIANIEYDRVSVIVSPVEIPKPLSVELVSLGGVALQRSSYPRGVIIMIASVTLAGLAGFSFGILLLRFRKKKTEAA